MKKLAEAMPIGMSVGGAVRTTIDARTDLAIAAKKSNKNDDHQ